MSKFLEELSKIKKLLKQMTEQAELIGQMANMNRVNLANEYAMRLEEKSERLTFLTRSLPAYTGSPVARECVRNIVAEAIPTKIGFTKQGWFSVRIPLLLPKKGHGSVDYIRGFLNPAMQDFFKDKPPVRYDDCVIIFRHVYDRDRPERQWRDHDNIELNIVVDIVVLYTMRDDSPIVCDHYYCSDAASEERTEVYVVPRDEFTRWLDVEKIMPDNGVELYDKP